MGESPITTAPGFLPDHAKLRKYRVLKIPDNL
jgi:hypothetical protein